MTMPTTMTRSFVCSISLLCAGACHAPDARTDAPEGAGAGVGAEGVAVDAMAAAHAAAELETQFSLALSAFDRGAYDRAADLFVQTLLKVPRDPSGDALRHHLVQHIAWSLLGSYDMSGDASRLDEGEALLERYLVRHEQLLPQAHGPREAIYGLLGEFASRRAGQNPRYVREELLALSEATMHSIREPASSRRGRNEDRMVREIEVDTIEWATLDDPEVQLYFRDIRYTGVSVFERPGDPFNHTRVLVRGWVSKREFVAAGRLAFASLREARPALETCYELALARGDVNLFERVEIGLAWTQGRLDQVEFVDALHFDEASRDCLSAALYGAQPEAAGEALAGAGGAAQARLQLSFLVQPERWPGRGDVDWDYFDSAAPIGPGEIGAGAVPEDVSY